MTEPLPLGTPPDVLTAIKGFRHLAEPARQLVVEAAYRCGLGDCLPYEYQRQLACGCPASAQLKITCPWCEQDACARCWSCSTGGCISEHPHGKQEPEPPPKPQVIMESGRSYLSFDGGETWHDASMPLPQFTLTADQLRVTFTTQ